MNIFSQIENFLHPPEKCAEGSAKAATGHDRFLPRCERKMLFILCCWGRRLYFLHHVNFSGLPKRFISWKMGFQNPSKFEKIAFFISAENALVWIDRNTIEISQFFWLWRNMVFVWTCTSYAKQSDHFFFWWSDPEIIRAAFTLPPAAYPRVIFQSQISHLIRSCFRMRTALRVAITVMRKVRSYRMISRTHFVFRAAVIWPDSRKIA